LLLQRLQRVIRDARVMQLITRVIDSGRGILDSEAPRFVFPGDDLFSQLRPRGLPIGNLTSQFFANVYLDSLDHFIREELRVPGYVRYADDLVLFGHSRTAMWEYRAAIEAFAAGLRLRLHEKKTHAAPATQTLNFLGMRVSRDQIRLSRQGLRRFTRRLRRMQHQLESGRCSFADIRGSFRAWLAHTRQANSTGLVRVVLKRLRLRRRRRADPGG
jgi:RNA-directed DNA polymerase